MEIEKKTVYTHSDTWRKGIFSSPGFVIHHIFRKPCGGISPGTSLSANDPKKYSVYYLYACTECISDQNLYKVCAQVNSIENIVFYFRLQLLYAHRPPDDHQHRNRAYSSSDVQENMSPESMKLNVGISSNGDVDVAEISLADMDPEDIRVRSWCLVMLKLVI